MLEGLVPHHAGGADAVGRHREDLQEEHAVGLLKGVGLDMLLDIHRAQHAQRGALGEQQPQHGGVLGPHAPHDLAHLRHCHEARPAHRTLCVIMRAITQ